MKNKICVLGAFAFCTSQFDGQTIKTRNLLTLLQNHNLDVDFFDTQDFKFNKLLVLRMFRKVMTCNTLYYLPAHNNLTYLFPIIYWLSRLSHTRIHYFVVGGWLSEFLKDKPQHSRKLARIAGIHCETHSLKESLEKNYGFQNVDVFPNFRISDYTPTSHHEEGKLKLVFMARILKMKGLDLIFKLGDEICRRGLQEYISVDFYGPLQNEDDDVDYFNSNLVRYGFMRYNGLLKPTDIYSTLEKYDAMLLPTHFYTEGMPGSILDAYISGIPVIVTKWKYAAEFVDDGKSGFIIPFEDDGSALVDAVMKLYEDTALLSRMKLSAQEQCRAFSSEKAYELVQNYE